MKASLMTDEDLGNFGTQVKDILLRYMSKHDIITEEKYKELSKTLAVIIKKKGLLSWFYDSGEKDPIIVVVKYDEMDEEQE